MCACLLQAMIVSIGMSMNAEGRRRFDMVFKQALREAALQGVQVPEAVSNNANDEVTTIQQS